LLTGVPLGCRLDIQTESHALTLGQQMRFVKKLAVEVSNLRLVSHGSDWICAESYGLGDYMTGVDSLGNSHIAADCACPPFTRLSPLW